MDSIKAMDQNIQKENTKLDGDKDQKKTEAFLKKVGFLANKVPVVREVWKKLGMAVKEADPTFKKISGNMQAILDKAKSVEKGMLSAFDNVSVVQVEKPKALDAF